MIYESDRYHRFNLMARNWVATGGIMNHCKEKACFWVLDIITSYIPKLSKMKDVDYFLIITIEVKENKSAIFTMKQENQEDNTHRVLVKQKIEFTDLEESWEFWAINEGQNRKYDPTAQTVMLLKEEY